MPMTSERIKELLESCSNKSGSAYVAISKDGLNSLLLTAQAMEQLKECAIKRVVSVSFSDQRKEGKWDVYVSGKNMTYGWDDSIEQAIAKFHTALTLASASKD